MSAKTLTPTEQRARDEKSLARLGAKVRETEAALNVLDTVARLEACGIAPTEASFLMPPKEITNEFGERETIRPDAREVVAEAEAAVKAAGRPGGRYMLTDARRMAGRDVAAIAGRAANAAAARVNRQVTKADRLGADEKADIAAELTLRICRHGGASDSLMPAWGEMDRAEWTAWATAQARTAIRERHEAAQAIRRLMAEDDGETNAQALHGAKVRRLTAEAAAIAGRLETALGRTLGAPERTTLELALGGLSRRDIAERDGLTLDQVRDRAKNGRKRLGRDLPDARTFRRLMTPDVEGVEPDEILAERVADTWTALMDGGTEPTGAIRWTGPADRAAEYTGDHEAILPPAAECARGRQGTGARCLPRPHRADIGEQHLEADREVTYWRKRHGKVARVTFATLPPSGRWSPGPRRFQGAAEHTHADKRRATERRTWAAYGAHPYGVKKPCQCPPCQRMAEANRGRDNAEGVTT